MLSKQSLEPRKLNVLQSLPSRTEPYMVKNSLKIGTATTMWSSKISSNKPLSIVLKIKTDWSTRMTSTRWWRVSKIQRWLSKTSLKILRRFAQRWWRKISSPKRMLNSLIWRCRNCRRRLLNSNVSILHSSQKFHLVINKKSQSKQLLLKKSCTNFPATTNKQTRAILFQLSTTLREKETLISSIHSWSSCSLRVKTKRICLSDKSSTKWEETMGLKRQMLNSYWISRWRILNKR